MSITYDQSYAYLVTTHAAPPSEETDPYCLPPSSAALLLADAPWHRFAVIGDSLSAGTGDPCPGYVTMGWADRVADILRRIHPGLAYINTGEIRATTARTLETQIDSMAQFAPDLLHIPCGANDLLRREPDFDAITTTLRRMYSIAADTGAQLTTFTLGRAYSVPAFPDWTQRVLRINDTVRALAREYDAAIIDMYEHPVNGRDNLLSADRVHFNASGQAVMATEYVRALASALNREMSV